MEGSQHSSEGLGAVRPMGGLGSLPFSPAASQDSDQVTREVSCSRRPGARGSRGQLSQLQGAKWAAVVSLRGVDGSGGPMERGWRGVR